ncbi:MAG: deoxyribose-phosphate aldolase [Bacteroidales bacterium]|nr:deoxyribose-phosphate aldolase [Bacteroidales bacterium]
MDKHTVKQLLSFVDLTTLSGDDTRAKVDALCQKALNLQKKNNGQGHPAAICVYPPFAAQVKAKLAGSGILTACVAGAFPSGQSPLETKVLEVQWTAEQGVDEIDAVINRGMFLEGRYEEVKAELVAIKKACGKAHLKVILETGELKTPGHIRLAAELAIAAGADFIKTSTGKSMPAATLEAVRVMAEVVMTHFRKTGEKVGIKPAGGISTPDDALAYASIVQEVLGMNWLTPDLFRIGASRLVDNLELLLV